MKFQTKIKNSLALIIMVMAGVSCSQEADLDGNQATVNGRVAGDNSAAKSAVSNVENATVTAASIQSDGSIQTIEGTETQTDVSGNFTLTFNADAAQNIVLVATKETAEWKGYVASEIENGSEYIIKPLDSESNAETEVYSEIVATGNADIVTKSDVEYAVSTNAATNINSGSAAASSFATGINNAARTRAEFYAEKFSNSSDAALDTFLEATAEAQLQYEAELNSSGSAGNNFDVYTDALINAYSESGLTASETAKLVDVWGRVIMKGLSGSSDETSQETRKNTSYIAAIAIHNAVEIQAEASGMSDTSLEAISNAGADLRADIQASSGATADIDAAFQQYKDSVRQTAENDGKFDSAVIVDIDSEINATGSFKDQFESSISALLDVELYVDAYLTFTSSVETYVESQLNGLSETEVAAVSDLFVLINLQS